MVKLALGLTSCCMLGLLGAAACNSVVGLDVSYRDASAPSEDSGSDSGRAQVRPSTLDASIPDLPTVEEEPTIPCNADAGLGSEEGACDDSAGRGCCLQDSRPGQGSQCLALSAANTDCSLAGAPGVFVACRHSQADSLCCWTDLPNHGRIARYTAQCAPSDVACIDDSGCAGLSGSAGPLTCITRVCRTSGFVIGQCGSAPSCPEDL